MNTDANSNLADILGRDDRFKVLRRLEEPWAKESDEPVRGIRRTLVLVDVETTGLDPENDAIIELALMQVVVESEGDNLVHKVISWTKPEEWLQDPGREIPEKIAFLTGITDDAVAGQRIDDDRVLEVLSNADLIIAHNARFDRAFIEQRYLELGPRAWACSMSEIDWLTLEMDGKNLGYLLMQSGRFYPAHHAANDVWSLFKLLTSTPVRFQLLDQRSCLDLLLEASDAETYRVEALNAPFGFKDRLKARGYKWDPKKKVWWTELGYPAYLDERDWFAALGLPSFAATPIDATQRHL